MSGSLLPGTLLCQITDVDSRLAPETKTSGDNNAVDFVRKCLSAKLLPISYIVIVTAAKACYYVHREMMNESKFDLKSAHLITSLFFICHLFFTSESSPRHSYVYIPLFDKVCLIEKYIPQEYPTTSRIPIFIYNSLESCIAACSSYSTGELLCNAFMYSDITKACHLHFYALNLKTGMCPVETGRSQFYLLHGCFNRNNSLLNANVNKKNETDDKIIFLPALHKFCLIRRRLVSESWFAKPISHMTTSNLRQCLSRCVVKGAAACNSVIFSLQEKSCTLVAHQSVFSTLSVTVQSSAYFFEIDHCKTKKTCLLMKLDVNSSETTDLVLYNFFKDTVRREKLIFSNYEDTLRFETSFVSLHEFHERCQILTFTSAYAENLKVHSLALQTNSLNGCLTACRNKANDTLNCSGVLFSKQEEVCYKLVEGTSHDQIVTEDDQTIVLLQCCVKDREEERRGNSMFYHYHLYELEETCVFESYNSNHISGFAVYDNILQAISLYQCILKCASEQISKGCAAVHKSQEGCLFFRRNSAARIFRKLGSSYFAELLFCESKFARNILDFDAAQQLSSIILAHLIRPQFYATEIVRIQSAIAYTASNLHLRIAVHHELFYASKAAIRLRLRDSADKIKCLNVGIASNTSDYCDAYYFSSREYTCLTMRLKKQYALPGHHGHRSITKFYDDETLNITFKDANEPYLKYPEHVIQMEVSLHEFKEICIAQHYISTLNPIIRFSEHFANISFFNEYINICRYLKNSAECKGIAYYKK
ncbi:hypothetical protein T11_16641 [Trichinella zimbabwensis]|uniref:Apple domain-containing protein n=1 Tax=Trichinella zimbabwensis TaxID=268475 RepID=A0A0V1HVP2_9BILA|nr:hypothetical protein T11_16641 [Trichinella zimbabwensis]